MHDGGDINAGNNSTNSLRNERGCHATNFSSAGKYKNNMFVCVNNLRLLNIQKRIVQVF